MKLGWLAAIAVLGAVLAITWMLLRRRPRRVLSIALKSRAAAGSWSGEIPPETLVMAACQLCLLWACKVRWLLNSEPEHTRPALSSLMIAMAGSLSEGSAQNLHRDLSAPRQLLQALGMGGSPVGAVLNLNLYYTGRGPIFWLLTNSLPSGSTHGDWIWSVAHLVVSATKNLDPMNTRALSASLAELAQIFDTQEADDPSMSTLQQMFAEANQIYLTSSLREVHTQ